MFNALKQESNRLGFERGASVTLGTAEMLRISDNENLQQHDDLRHLNFLVRSFLEQWCRDNITCRWELERDIAFEPDTAAEDILRFSFSRKREAVRFKLTWGGR